MKIINLNFVGPFSFTNEKTSVFKTSYSKSRGIYLWTVKQKKEGYHLIHYVGESTSFAKRQKEHLINILGLNYGIFDPVKAQEGVSELLWKGLWRTKTDDGPEKQIIAYQKLNSLVVEYLSIINIFFAETDVESNVQKHIEGCIGWNLRNKYPEYKVLYPDDNHVGTKAEKNIGQLIIQSSEPIKGLDGVIDI